MVRIAYLALHWTSAVSRWLKRRFTAPGLLVLGAAWAGAVLGVDTDRSMSYQLFALLAAALALAAPFALRSGPRLAIERSLPRLATAGTRLSYRLTVRNQSATPQRGVAVIDNLADPRPGYAQFEAAVAAQWSLLSRPTVFDIWRTLVAGNGSAPFDERALSDLPPGHALELTVEITPQRRGALHFESVTVARPDPLNLVRSCADYRVPGTVLVLPKCHRLPQLALPGARRYQHGGVALATSVGDAEEFVSLRDYRPGDALQRVHWKSFARVGYPVVKEYQDEFYERHALVLDTFAGAAGDEAFEDAVAVAASFAAAVDTRESLLDLMFVGRQTYCFTAGRGQMGAQQLLEVLAVVARHPEGSFRTLADSVLAGRARLSSAILVLLAWDEPRRELASKLRATGLQVLALVVSAAPPQADERAPWLVTLAPGKIAQGLAALGT